MKFKTLTTTVVLAISLLALVILNSCTRYEVGEGAPPPMQVGTVRAEGRPVFNAGFPASYWIWHDRAGWHLRVTTAGLRRQFSGTVESTTGFIESFHPASLELRDRVRVERNRLIRFDFWTRGDIDGFDWNTSSMCNNFNLYIDGAPHPERIFVGGFSDIPPSPTFQACW